MTLRQPLEAPIDSKDVLIRLAQRWESCLGQQDLSERAKYESLYYSVRAEEEDARSVPVAKSPEANPVRRHRSFHSSWMSNRPGTSHECMAAAEVAKKAGMDALSCTLIERTLKLT